MQSRQCSISGFFAWGCFAIFFPRGGRRAANVAVARPIEGPDARVLRNPRAAALSRITAAERPHDHPPASRRPAGPARYTGAVAIDTETMGLEPARDRLCVVQLSPGDGSADVVQIGREIGPAPNLKALLGDATKLKIFHFARFDIGDAVQMARRDAAAGLLHQDRLAADPHLHRQARPEGPDQGPARQGHFQAAAADRLGRRAR